MSFIEFSLLLCFVQSILLAVSLLSFKRNKIANRLLACQVLVWGIMCYYRFTVFQNADYILLHHFILKFNNVVFLTFFVFPFLYVKYMSTGYTVFRRTDLWHFLPAFLAFIALIPFFILSGQEKIELMLASPPVYFHWVHLIIDNVALVQGVVYFIFSLKYISIYHRHVKEDYSNIDHLTLYWLRNMTILIFIIWFWGALGSNLYLFHLIKDYYFNFLFILVGGSIYLISYYAFTRQQLFTISHNQTDPVEVCPLIEEYEHEGNKILYNKKEFQLGEDYCKTVIGKLTRAMEVDKLYLNQNLSLDEVSQVISVPRYHLSFILNKKLNNTFFDYINKYRVEEVKKMMKDSKMEKLTLLAIAFEAGFASKATFNRSFKKYENVTPQEYRLLHCS